MGTRKVEIRKVAVQNFALFFPFIGSFFQTFFICPSFAWTSGGGLGLLTFENHAKRTNVESREPTKNLEILKKIKRLKKETQRSENLNGPVQRGARQEGVCVLCVLCVCCVGACVCGCLLVSVRGFVRLFVCLFVCASVFVCLLVCVCLFFVVSVFFLWCLFVFLCFFVWCLFVFVCVWFLCVMSFCVCLVFLWVSVFLGVFFLGVCSSVSVFVCLFLCVFWCVFVVCVCFLCVRCIQWFSFHFTLSSPCSSCSIRSEFLRRRYQIL